MTYSKAATLLWLQGPKKLPASARVKGLVGGARAGLGYYQEKRRESEVSPFYFEKVGGGAFIYRRIKDRWCIGPTLDGEDIVWAETICPSSQLPYSDEEAWRADAGKPQVSVTRPCVNIVSGAGFRSADLDGLSDPYIACSIPGKPHLSFKTEVKCKTLEPQWHELHVIDGAELGDILQFRVMDWDEDGNHDLIGEAKWTLAPGGFKGELGLTLRGRKAGGLRLEMYVPQMFAEQTSSKKKASQTTFDSNNPRAIVNALSYGSFEESGRALGSVRSLVTSEEIRSRFVAAGIVQLLVALLSDAPKERRSEVAAALANLAQCSVGRRIIVTSGGVEALLNLLLAPGPLISKEETIEALLQLVAADKVQSQILESGAVLMLLELLKQRKSLKASAKAACLLARLAAKPEVASSLLEQNVATMLLDLLSAEHPQDANVQAAFALESLANTDENRRALVEAGAVWPLAGQLKEGSLDTKAQAAATITALASVSDGRMFKKIVYIMLDAGVMPPLLDMLAEHHTGCVEQATIALCKLASSRKTSTAMISAGVLPKLLVLLKSRNSPQRRTTVAKVLQALDDFNKSAMESSRLQDHEKDLISSLLRELRSDCLASGIKASPRQANSLPSLPSAGANSSMAAAGGKGKYFSLPQLPSAASGKHGVASRKFNMGLDLRFAALAHVM
eukprot:gb/GFBE01076856.1/.p1 GENE.gb/GFBE01076856.1/~~gb/GFBE01076856.1/.p1  ORF type:complete len:678 (+),score=147.01 gb/GFBE01076856.1/:1-2034(+)